MKLDNLKEETLVEILRIYEENCGFGRPFREAMYQRPKTVLEHLKQHLKRWDYEEYRVGSKWDINSKIFFERDFDGNITIRFSSNFLPEEREGPVYEEAEKAGEEFVKVAMKYLNEH